MAGPFLFVGNDRKLPGFIQAGEGKSADRGLRVADPGLGNRPSAMGHWPSASAAIRSPLADDSVEGILCDHYLESLTPAEAVGFLRECCRVLVPGGRLRVATTDLDALAARLHGSWWEKDWLADLGQPWQPNGCCLLNTVLRQPGRQWVCNEEELSRLAAIAGLGGARRRAFGESEEPRFRNVDAHPDALIMEFRKPTPGLVSILIAAYRATYFQAALESALRQSYPHTEIIIGDDSSTDAIARIVAEFAPDPRLVYRKNERRLRTRGNYQNCFQQARGEFIKFLNDDDLLSPDGVARMVAVLQARPDVTLVTSNRRVINEMPGVEAPRSTIVNQDLIAEGRSAAGCMLAALPYNIIGEPTTTMFRRRDADAQPNLMSFAGQPYFFCVDIVMWTNLLSKGNLVYLADHLSSYRMHPAQVGRSPEALEQGLAALAQLRASWIAQGGVIPQVPILEGRPFAS